MSIAFVIYTVVFILSLISFPIYFKLAEKYGVIDRPNERSSHSEPTIRGAGILLIICYICFFAWSNYYLALGCILAAIVGYVDDRITLRAMVRLPLYMLSVLLTFLELNIFNESAWYVSLIFFVVALGVINTYNFMDGINGITGMYSTVFFLTIGTVHAFVMELPQLKVLVPLIMIYLVIFGFYNYRQKAKTFLGDAGSVSIGLLVVYMVLAMIKNTDDFTWIVLLLVYGVDSVGTIIMRIIRRENIFLAHRSHLYQDMTNIVGHSHLKVSMAYAFVQLTINILWLANYHYHWISSYILLSMILISLIVFYLWYKKKHNQLIFSRS